MLKQLFVQNFAIIEKSEISLQPGLTIITGETGAGKSILLSALSLILGERASANSLFHSEHKAIVEAVFLLSAKAQPFFKEHDLDFFEETIVRREIRPNGKSRAFINDTPVTLDKLKAFSLQQIDLHRQHESLALTSTQFQREIIDTLAGTTKQVLQYQNLYATYKQQLLNLQHLKETEKNNQQEQDFIQFQVKELEEAKIVVGEYKELEGELALATNFEQIQQHIQNVLQQFSLEEHNTADALQAIVYELRQLTKLSTNYSPIYKRVNSAIVELEDSISELQGFVTDEFDEERIAFVHQRIDVINKLLNKHAVQSDEALLEQLESFQQRLQGFSSVSKELLALEQSIKDLRKQLEEQAHLIYKQRKDSIPTIEKNAQQLLKEVGMPNGAIQIHIIQEEEFNAFGKDAIDFLFSANKGQQPQALKQVASGGELSRLLLALKSLIAGKTTQPTLIFDEIDTGISGEVAKKVGQVMRKLSDQHQVIAITHLPQIAALGHHHLKVVKNIDAQITTSTVQQLNEKERVQEVAEMLGGENPSQTHLKAAKELFQH